MGFVKNDITILELAGVQLPTDDWLQLIGLPPKSTDFSVVLNCANNF